MKIAYCRDCKTVIAVGDLASQQTIVVRGKRSVLKTMPHHTVNGEEHRDVGLLDVPDQPIPVEKVDRWMKSLTEKYKEKFE